MSDSFVIDLGGTPIEIQLPGSTAEAIRQATRAAAAAQAALAAAGIGEYADTAAGLADTAIGETFWTDAGDGTGVIYRHDPGPTPTFIGRFIKDPTGSGTAALLGATGGTVDGRLLSQAASIASQGASISTLETNTKVDVAHNRVRVGDNVGLHHITTGSRTQGGANLDGSLFIVQGVDIATSVDSDITASNAFGSAIWNATNAKIYGCDVHSFRGQVALLDGMYVASFAIDAFKDITFGRNSNAVAPKAGLHVTDVRSSTLLSVLSGAGGGALENCLIGGLNACDYFGSTSRVLLKDAVILGADTARGLEGDVDTVVVGNSSMQALLVTGTQNTILAHAGGQTRTSSSFGLDLGYGSGSTTTTANFAMSIGPLSDAGNNANSVAIGGQVVCGGPNEIVIGGSGHTVKVSNAIVVTCDADDKIDIVDLEFDGEFFDRIPVRQFRGNFRDAYVKVEPHKFEVEEPFVDEVLAATGLLDRRGRRILRPKKVKSVRKVTKTKIERRFDAEAHARGEKAGKRIRVSAVAQELDELRKQFDRDYPGLQWSAHNNDLVDDEYQVDPKTGEFVLDGDGQRIPLTDEEHSERAVGRWHLDPNPTFWMNVRATQIARADIRKTRRQLAELTRKFRAESAARRKESRELNNRLAETEARLKAAGL